MEKRWKVLVINILFSLAFFNNIGKSICLSTFITKEPKILIIGAGPAGIAAASKLFESGFKDVTILEAQNRIGGRIYSTELGEYSVDLGGQWVHGNEGNVAFELANPLGLLNITLNQDSGKASKFVDSSGELISDEIGNQILDFADKYTHGVVGYKSVGEYQEKSFEEVFKNSSNILAEKEKYLHILDLILDKAESSKTWYDVSATNLDKFQKYPGDHNTNWKTKTYSTILDIMIKRYPNPEEELPVLKNTILNSEVDSIDYRNAVDGPVLVHTKNGKLYTADHVILTVSLGVLKRKHRSLFIPPLPRYKINTIMGLGFGTVTKIYLLFKQPFWSIPDGTNRLIFLLLWNEHDKKIIESQPKKSWVLGISEIQSVNFKPNLLQIWVVGKSASQVEELSEDEVMNCTVEILRKFLEKNYDVPEPIGILRSQWYSNPHFRGTYSFPSVEAEKRNVTPALLEKPLLPENLKVLFAGEATSTKRFSTVDGAIGSGWNAAGRLIKHYKDNIKNSLYKGKL